MPAAVVTAKLRADISDLKRGLVEAKSEWQQYAEFSKREQSRSLANNDPRFQTSLKQAGNDAAGVASGFNKAIGAAAALQLTIQALDGAVAAYNLKTIDGM